MQARKSTFRTLLAGAAFAAAMGFGAVQAIATDGDDPGTDYEACTTYACRAECPEFGGQLRPGGPGKPLKCYCCG